MSEEQQIDQPDEAQQAEQQKEIREQFKMVKVIYVLFVFALLFPVTGLVGVIMAHVSAGESQQPVLSHFRYQYRTFWIGLLGFAVAALTAYVLVGFLLLGVIGLWWLVRCARGLIVANQARAIDKPDSWLF